MELPEIGKNCSQKNCNNLDFLPFNCPFCKLVFCKNHFQPFVHECLCAVKENVSILKGTSHNVKCTYKDCSVEDVTEMLCVKCGYHFCLKHRYHECFNVSEEECRVARKKLHAQQEEFAKTLTEVNRKVNENLERLKRTTKHEITAAKIQLIRLKGKANGNSAIPTTDRIYFQIYLPLALKRPTAAIFIAKNWSLGRAIDEIAAFCNIKNQNNETFSPKLRLFCRSNGIQPGTNMSVPLKELLESDLLHNGQSLILEYVPINEDLSHYVISEPSQYT